MLVLALQFSRGAASAPERTARPVRAGGSTARRGGEEAQPPAGSLDRPPASRSFKTEERTSYPYSSHHIGRTESLPRWLSRTERQCTN
jgi:hypothetical protein